MLDIPILITQFHQLYPHSGQGHGESEVEANASIFMRPTEPGHARHILSDKDHLLVNIPSNKCSQHQEHHSIMVEFLIEVLLIIASKGIVDTMVVVEDGCDSIKPKPISIVFLQPKPHISKQKSQHLVLAVVEYFTVPKSMVATIPRMEVLIIGSIPLVDAFVDVFCCVCMHDVDYHLYIVFMRFVNQLL
jgi:hypothetical protein